MITCSVPFTVLCAEVTEGSSQSEGLTFGSFGLVSERDRPTDAVYILLISLSNCLNSATFCFALFDFSILCLCFDVRNIRNPNSEVCNIWNYFNDTVSS